MQDDNLDEVISSSEQIVADVDDRVFHRGEGIIYEEFFDNRTGKVIKEQVTRMEEKDLADLKPKAFTDPPARVAVGQTYSVNMGDYESYRIFVSLSLPCKQDEVDATYTKIDKWITDRIAPEMKDADSFALARNGKKRGPDVANGGK